MTSDAIGICLILLNIEIFLVWVFVGGWGLRIERRIEKFERARSE